MARHRNPTFASAIRLAHRLRWLGLERHLYWPAWQRRMERLEHSRVSQWLQDSLQWQRQWAEQSLSVQMDSKGQCHRWEHQQWVRLPTWVDRSQRLP